MYIKQIADKLAKKYQTRDPFAIADALGFITVFVPLQGVRGFFQRAKRCNIIYIDDQLDDQQRKLVCAHEVEEIEELTIPQISRCWGVPPDICQYRVELSKTEKSPPSVAALDEL